MTLWEPHLGQEMSVDLYLDSQATARIIQTGKAPTVRHIERVYQVCVAWLRERLASEDVQLENCNTEVMAK